MEIDYLFEKVKSGMVAIVGPPNAGKSTLMNYLLGQKISIVTPKPQTTRNRILGVVNGDDYQIVLIDTPGLHKSDQPLNREMVKIAIESLQGVDAILFLIDVAIETRKDKNDKADPEKILPKDGTPTFLILNKTDLIDKRDLLPLITHYNALCDFTAIHPVSAKNGDGTEDMVKNIVEHLPVGPKYFPDDIPTDASERFIVSEIIREKVFLLTGQEIPYSAAVIIDSFKEQKKNVTIHATIVVEKSSQKGIVIGKGGHKLKSIGIAARKDIEKMMDIKVVLKLWVKVKKNWSKNSSFLKEIGF